jgi:uncharacterized protein YdeI (YjbR/CyaY-like superfamily)
MPAPSTTRAPEPVGRRGSEAMIERAHVEIESIGELQGWLGRHHRQSESVWLVSFKKAAGARYVPYQRIVEELLAWGWIDSKPGKVDDQRTKLLVGPRNPRSAWSKANRERIAQLEREGRLQALGRAAVEAAKANGSWQRLMQAETGRAPPVLAAALKASGVVKGWRALSLATRKRALEFLGAAKTDATRAKRVAQIVEAARAGRDPTAWTPKS